MIKKGRNDTYCGWRRKGSGGNRTYAEPQNKGHSLTGNSPTTKRSKTMTRAVRWEGEKKGTTSPSRGRKMRNEATITITSTSVQPDVASQPYRGTKRALRVHLGWWCCAVQLENVLQCHLGTVF